MTCCFMFQSNTCYIEGECYQPDDQSADDANMICDPADNAYAWTPKGKHISKKLKMVS